MPHLPLFSQADDGPHVSLSPRDPKFFQDPYPAYAELHQTAPSFFWEEYGHWCFTGYNTVNSLLRDRRFGRQVLHVASRDEIGMGPPKAHLKDWDRLEARSLLELEPPDHTRLRTLVNRAFVSRNIGHLRPDIEKYAGHLLDNLAPAGRMELIKEFGEPVPATIIARMLGIPTDNIDQLLDWSHRMVLMYTYGVTEDIERDANLATQEFSEYVRTLIALRRADPQDDLLSHMIVTEKDGQHLTEDELISTTVLLLNAGHEATVHQLGNAVNTILSRGLDPSELFATPQTTALAVEECMRIAAPLHMFMRWVLEDTEVDGVVLKKGDRIGLMLGAANHDPKQFPKPQMFQADRNQGAHLAFGAGLHFCIGAPLARLELQIVLPMLFDRLPGLMLQEPPRMRNAYHFYSAERIDLSW